MDCKQKHSFALNDMSLSVAVDITTKLEE